MQVGINSFAGKRQIQALVMGLVLVGVIWELAAWIVAGSDRNLLSFGTGLVACAIILHIMTDWRSGVILFLGWLVFEDLARKYLGNSMTVYFTKDLIVGVAYISFLVAKRRGLVTAFKIPFLIPLTIFFCYALVQVFNPWTPSILYGFLGMKLYFYYAPLMLLGYAMMEKPEDLDRLLQISIITGILVAVLGIIQSVVGIDFLTPVDLAPELVELTRLTRRSPVTHLDVPVTTSVFVSVGRFSQYLILIWILAVGTQGYLLLSRRRGAKWGFLAIGVVSVGVIITGNRTPVVFVVISALMMTAAFLWGAPWRWGQGHRLVKALRRTLFIAALALIVMVEVYPNVMGAHWAFVSETLAFRGEGSELVNRTWDYPLLNLQLAFQHERWIEGYGTGLNSLGSQYVARFLDQPIPNIGVENGFGGLLVEMGIVAPFLWLYWVGAMLWAGWKVVRRLRRTVYFPIGFALLWNAAVLTLLLMYFGVQSYQNFVNNAYMWLLMGVLFRLPHLAEMPQPVPVPMDVRHVPRLGLAMEGQ
jgi:hypothetical protein